MKKCYRCNRQFSDEALMFCPYCGSPLSIDKEWHAEQERKAREKAEAKRKEEEWEAHNAEVIADFARWLDKPGKSDFEADPYSIFEKMSLAEVRKCLRGFRRCD